MKTALKALASLRDLASSQLKTCGGARLLRESTTCCSRCRKRRPTATSGSSISMMCARCGARAMAPLSASTLRCAARSRCMCNGRQLLKTQRPRGHVGKRTQPGRRRRSGTFAGAVAHRRALRRRRDATAPRTHPSACSICSAAPSRHPDALAGAMIADFVKAAVATLPIGIGSRLVLLKRIERSVVGWLHGCDPGWQQVAVRGRRAAGDQAHLCAAHR